MITSTMQHTVIKRINLTEQKISNLLKNLMNVLGTETTASKKFGGFFLI